jgi:hypothetical protein
MSSRDLRILSSTLVLVMVVASASVAAAHEAKSGWRYPYACCSDQDCREVPANKISESRSGYRIEATGEVLAYSDKRVRPSPDGLFHWCSVAGKENTKTICLFVPPSSF